MDMILVQKRTVDDRVQWFLERDRFEEALKVAEKFSSELKVQSVENVGKMYVDYLLEENEFGEAARCVHTRARVCRCVYVRMYVCVCGCVGGCALYPV